MATKKTISISEDILKLYDSLIASNPEIERKGKTNPYTSWNGNMFTHLSPEGILAIRLAETDREAFIQKYNAKLQESNGIIRKEYVVVPDALLKNTRELKGWLDKSLAYVKTLKTKPSRKDP